MCIGKEIQYYKADQFRVCPPDQIITKEKECEDASLELKMAYNGIVTNHTGRPVGCFWHNTHAYFNPFNWAPGILTTPVGNRGGICKKICRLIYITC